MFSNRVLIGRVLIAISLASAGLAMLLGDIAPGIGLGLMVAGLAIAAGGWVSRGRLPG